MSIYPGEDAALREALAANRALRGEYIERLENPDSWDNKWLEIWRERVVLLQAEELRILEWLS